jgi:hypothetical protein
MIDTIIIAEETEGGFHFVEEAGEGGIITMEDGLSVFGNQTCFAESQMELRLLGNGF